MIEETPNEIIILLNHGVFHLTKIKIKNNKMKNTFKTIFIVAALVLIYSACTKQEYSLGDLTAPSNIVITTEVVGQDANNPDGDGSGTVNIAITADNALAFKVGYDAKLSSDCVAIPLNGKVTKNFAKNGVNTYRITALVFGKGGTSSLATADVTVRSDFKPDPAIITNLTGDASKTWVVDPSVPGHFGVGPWSNTSVTPEWWAAAINEKVNCCNCFYTATFTFTKVVASGTYSLTVATPDGAFTKTGDLAGGLPGIPASGAEDCYSYDGGTSDFSFIRASTGIESPTSTQTSILLSGNNTFIGYGAVLKEYEIFEINPDYMYLRVQGTETGNAWYLKMIPAVK
jgi:hypothetical protein